MLVLTRKPGESIRIGSNIRITLVSSSGGQARVAIEAPEHVPVHREEVYERIAEANREAAEASGGPEPQTNAAGSAGQDEER